MIDRTEKPGGIEYTTRQRAKPRAAVAKDKQAGQLRLWEPSTEDDLEGQTYLDFDREDCE